MTEQGRQAALDLFDGCFCGINDDGEHEYNFTEQDLWTIRAALSSPRVEVIEEANIRIEAAKKRLCDAKAIHSQWSEMPKWQADQFAADSMNDIEQIIYSAICYLEGVDGPNRAYAKLQKGV